MKTNINTELFKRYAPKKKLEIIEQLTAEELMNVKPASLVKIVREVGSGIYKSRNKRLYISQDRQRGNSWNSTIEAIELIKGKLYLDVYVQYQNTDITILYPLSSFWGKGESGIEVNREDNYGNPRTYYARYDEGAKLRVIRSILEEYVYTKYHDKLKEDAV